MVGSKQLTAINQYLNVFNRRRVPFVLFGQALMFYTPYYLWKMWEDNKMRRIIQGLHIFTIREDSEVRDQKEGILSGYIVNNLHEHNGWAIRYFSCELMNLVIDTLFSHYPKGTINFTWLIVICTDLFVLLFFRVIKYEALLTLLSSTSTITL